MGRISKKEQVMNAIGGWINSGRYKAGMQLPTEQELMREFGVSRIVIREAVGTLASEKLLARRQGAGTFVTAEAFRPVPRSLPQQLAVMMPPLERESCTYHLILDGIEAEAGEHGLTVVFFNHQNRVEQARLGITRLAAQGLRLLVYTPLEIADYEWSNREILHQAARAGLHVVLTDKLIRGGGPASASFVGSNGYDGIRALVGHLVELGHRRIGCIMNDLSATARTRFAGFVEAIREFRLPLERELCQVDTVRRSPDEEGLAAAEQLLTLPEPPTAVVCVHDWAARNFYRVAAKLGVRIPEDVSVTGFDDLQFAGELTPPLTTVNQPLREVGIQAVRLLIAEFTSPEERMMKHLYLNTTPVYRSSTARLSNRKESLIK